ncbi:MAG TPA: hypothetical protein PK264_00260, partial [Hyphomicrobiaceae bacterium]|nr:hypothetical protein [Hyphomicrobiaceae bacterium]
RPDGVGEDARIGPQRHARIDERAAADATADDNMHVLAQADIEEGAGATDVHAPSEDAHLGAQFRKARGEVARAELATALDYGNALARTREAATPPPYPEPTTMAS